MRIARFTTGSDPRYAFVHGDPGAEELEVVRGDPLFQKIQPTGERIPLTAEGLRLLAPVIPRSKVVAVGKNYVEHVKEFGGEVPTSPLLFLKPNTAVVGPDDPIVAPEWTADLNYEAELAVIIGRVAKDVSVERALDYVLGYTVANDVTARDVQRAESQWTRAKGFDSSCPLGPWIATGLDPDAGLAVRSRVNGEARQDGNTRDMVFDVPYLVSFISHTFTLLPGDVILTGTPAGVGTIDAGDRVECEVEGIGVLSNPVVRRDAQD